MQLSSTKDSAIWARHKLRPLLFPLGQKLKKNPETVGWEKPELVKCKTDS